MNKYLTNESYNPCNSSNKNFSIFSIYNISRISHISNQPSNVTINNTCIYDEKYSNSNSNMSYALIIVFIIFVILPCICIWVCICNNIYTNIFNPCIKKIKRIIKKYLPWCSRINENENENEYTPSKFIRFLNKYLIENNNNIGSNNNNIGINNNIYCSICLDSLDSFYSNKNIIKLDCNHIFHYDCFLPWIESGNKTCPLCRNTFSI